MSEEYDMSRPNGVMLQAELLPCVNLAMVDSNVAVCNRCVLINDTDDELQDVEVMVSGDHIENQTMTIAHVDKHWTVELSTLTVNVDREALVGLQQPVTVGVTLEARCGDSTLAQSVCHVQLLPDNYWAGLRMMPAMLATLVRPASNTVHNVARKASDILGQLTGDPIFDNYQTQDNKRSMAQVEAIYLALQQMQLSAMPLADGLTDYDNPVRTPKQVVEQHMANCLEIALMAAACLEACHLNPLLVMMQSHVMVAAWLVDTSSINLVSDDSAMLLKAANDTLAEMVLFDVMACTEDENVTFDQARERAEQMLRGTQIRFNCFVDIKACRLQNISPSATDDDTTPEESGLAQLLDVSDQPSAQSVQEESTAAQITKQQIWERKLLDFSLRNNLLNMRIGKRVLPFISFGIDELEDHVAGGEDYNILPSPSQNRILPDENGIFDSTLVRRQWRRLVLDELKNHRLRSYLGDNETIDVLKYIHRASKTALEENGANSLFLAMGILKWFETDRSTKPRFAPILMIPVDLIRHGGGRYIIRSRDEETIINVTLIEMIRQQFELPMSGLSPLPTDANGVDVRQVLATMRSCIMSRPRWDVLDEAMLGLFSFSKFVMWNDIHNNAEQLAQHPVIQALTDSRPVGTDDTQQMPADARELDQTSSPEDFAIPVDADSSQIEAIIDSGRGKSFVLHGPPGTGKSQTITNIIANALFQGKRVLFVAEKMAALEVVQKRLKAIGIDPFCLELHSNKVTKRHLIEQLEKALNSFDHGRPSDYNATAGKLKQERETLSHYVLAMHSSRNCGMSLYECLTRYLEIDAEPLELGECSATTLTADSIAQAVELILSLDTVVKLTGPPQSNPLDGVVVPDTSPGALNRVAELMSQLAEQLETMRQHSARIGQLLGIEVGTRLTDYQALEQLCRLLADVGVLTPAMFDLHSHSQLQQLGQCVALGAERARYKREVDRLFAPSALALDAAELMEMWRTASEKWWIVRILAQYRLKKRLSAHTLTKRIDDPMPMLQTLDAYQQADAKCDATWQHMIESAFGMTIDKDGTDWPAMEQKMQRAQQLFDELDNRRSPEWYRHIVERLEAMSHDDTGFAVKAATLWQQAMQCFGQLQVTLRDIDACCLIEDRDRADLEQMADRVARHIVAMGRDWKLWTDHREQLCQLGLTTVVDRIAQGCQAQQVADAWQKGVYHTIAEDILASDPRLASFSGPVYEDTISKFRKLDQRFQELTKAELFHRLAYRLIDNRFDTKFGVENINLRRIILTKGRGMSVRGILDQLEGLLPYLAPCMLMSPISVAQFLSLGGQPFDIVIFDEASQMPTSEAVGAIARGKALIVVGDPKQMPPTSFFNVNQVDESEQAIDDLGSVLDDTIALDLPSKHLRWHYRSRHESLIAFSNAQYYDGRLITFPSVDDRDTRVTLVHVDGVYDYGRSRSNRAEAQAIVNEVLRRLRDKRLQQHSLGIVAFSISQQNLIDDLLMDAFALYPQLEALATQRDEPIFIKNLENVQGDERDVILFSIGYGPDASGRVSMNFGPLNNTGGERRLNVAVSRARYEMIVFSTLMPEQIDLNRSKSLGVKGLKMFLEYARDGRISYQTAIWHSNVGVMASQLAEVLRDNGYQVATDVGRSKFKIDLAIIDNNDPSKYMLGVLCDGKGYSDTKTVRDREVCQPAVLTMLGWKIVRIWMVDWFYNRDRVVKQVLDTLAAIKAEQGSKPAQLDSKPVDALPTDTGVKPVPGEPQPAKPALEFVTAKAAVRPVTTAEPAATAEPVTTAEPAAKSQPATKSQPADKQQPPKRRSSRAARPSLPTELGQVPYVEADVPAEPKGGAIIMTTRPTRTLAQMKSILQAEQPITFHYACKRMCRIWNVKHMNERVTRFVTWLLKQTAEYDDASSSAVPYFWDNLAMRDDYGSYRVKAGREWHDVPLVEVKNAILCLIQDQRKIDREILPSMIVELFGIKKCITLFREQITMALDQLVHDQLIGIDGDCYIACRRKSRKASKS